MHDGYIKLKLLCQAKAVNDVVPSNHAKETPRNKTVYKCNTLFLSRVGRTGGGDIVCLLEPMN